MRPTAVITVHKPREEVERLWRDPALRAPRIADAGAEVTFRDAPGDRGTEIHVMTVPPQGPTG